jgi:hypothetical protein
VVSKYSFFVEIIIWLLPPLKQYKGGYFFYFLVLALTPFASVFCYHYFKITPASVYVVSSSAMVVALQYYKNKKIRSGVALLILLFPVAVYLNDLKTDLFLIIIQQGIIITYLYFFLLEFLYDKKAVNIYMIILVVYVLSLIFKMLAVLADFQLGIIYYHLTTIFETLICIYFIFFNIENSPQFKLGEK